MAEHPGGLFAYGPITFGPKVGQLAAMKSGLDAETRVVPGDAVASDGPEQFTASAGQGVASGFQSNEAGAACADSAEELAKSRFIKMVEKEVNENDIRLT